MTDEQLRYWIERCKAMESEASDASTLFAWRQSWQAAEDTLAARNGDDKRPPLYDNGDYRPVPAAMMKN